MNTLNTIINGDVLESLRKLPDQSVHTCVTSPPYWGLRDYGHSDQIGLEKTPEEYVERMVEVFREVRRVLRDDGTLWLNLGDSYFRSGAITNGGNSSIPGGKAQLGAMKGANLGSRPSHSVLKTKDLVGIPWRVAFALQADGWYLRSDIIWEKGNCMPESVRDRPTKAHEYIFLLSKSPRYYYDADAIREPHKDKTRHRGHWKNRPNNGEGFGGLRVSGDYGRMGNNPKGRNKRTVWTVNTRPFKGAHFAVFPPDLIKPCILAGAPEKACPHCGAPWDRVREMVKSWREDAATNMEQSYLRGTTVNGKRMGKVRPSSGGMSVSEYRFAGWKQTCQCENNDGSGRGVVLDPFFGSGTTGLVAKEHGRDYIGIELNPEYIEIAKKRINDEI